METTDQQPPATLAGWPEADRRRLDALFDAVSFPTPSSFRFADGPTIEAASTPTLGGPQALVEALWPHLYEYAYARVLIPNAPRVRPEPGGNAPEFLGRLSVANATRRGWDPAWRVHQVASDGSVRVHKGGRTRQVPPGQYAFDLDPTRPPGVGEGVELLVCRETLAIQPGFYYALGQTLGCDHDDADRFRVYFHATAGGMPRLLSAVGRALNRFEVPYALKCRDNSGQFDRTDAAVLCLPRRFMAITLRLLEEIDELCEEVLRPGTPLFTREFRPGIGLADNPADSGSFGQSRCLLLALGLADAAMTGIPGRGVRHQAVASRFRWAGLNPARPHLNPGASDPYRGSEAASRPVVGKSLDPSRDQGPPDLSRGDDFLEAADRIGHRLCRDAVWWNGRCNWMTWASEQVSGRSSLVHRAALPGLSDGVAGIALFLAHLGQSTGDRQQATALEGAIRQLRSTSPRMACPGYTDGRLGVGQALVSIARILMDEPLGEEGTDLMRSAAFDLAKHPSESDLDSLAAAIIALVEVTSRGSQSDLIEPARVLADRAIGLVRDQLGPSGVSIGRVEIAHALLELERLAPDDLLKSTAADILGVRWQSTSRLDGHTSCSQERASLLRIREILGDRFAGDHEIADAVRVVTTAISLPGEDDHGLAYGRSGHIDFLLEAARSLGQPDLRFVAERAGRESLVRYQGPGLPWPCGPARPTFEATGLMSGVAGIGLTLLRLRDPDVVPSPFLPRPAGGPVPSGSRNQTFKR